MLHPAVPVIAPKPAPHDGLEGAEFGGQVGERLCALGIALEVPLRGPVCSKVGSARSFYRFPLVMPDTEWGVASLPGNTCSAYPT
jgi:hypothetical protein